LEAKTISVDYQNTTVRISIQSECGKSLSLNPADHGIDGDFVFFRIRTDKDDFILCANDIPTRVDMGVFPGDEIKVIGFPEGRSSHSSLPIWLSGYVASEPSFDIDDRPYFYIDCATTPGCSGSPVYKYSGGGTYATPDGGSVLSGKKPNKFLGIYSGRIQEGLTIGRVWKASALSAFAEKLDQLGEVANG
jgi:hypothetical protein